jgi:hypothetical protein
LGLLNLMGWDLLIKKLRIVLIYEIGVGLGWGINRE